MYLGDLYCNYCTTNDANLKQKYSDIYKQIIKNNYKKYNEI